MEALSPDLEARRHETERTLRTAVADLSDLLSVIRLIGSADVVADARAFTEVLVSADALITARARRPEDWQPVIDQLKLCRKRFVDVARSELGVPPVTAEDVAAVAPE